MYFIIFRSNENLSKAWRELQSSLGSNIWPTSLKDFVFFCNRFCSHPSDSAVSSDSRVVLLRRLINMTADLDVFPRLEELTTNENDKDILRKQHMQSLSTAVRDEEESESGDEEINSEIERVNTSSDNNNHTTNSIPDNYQPHNTNSRKSIIVKNESSINTDINSNTITNSITTSPIKNKTPIIVTTTTTSATSSISISPPSPTPRTVTSAPTTPTTTSSIPEVRGMTTRSGAARRKYNV